ncbi:hypothetical protein G6F57_001752 [Rhizopus arrhizus]|uniref:Uncharacterized protein n=1 Tax=Rhizopus oryzae TaxID=64495 RepID=A0A9P6X774_RHIOR|nr:hypothetical protein G6F24_003212 [Rhizopus arrhizus]KAG0949912.1 hypothetical protein G6F30_001982 [Rhizopus arrhizus]KAG0975828.1 hypothetical protein G6F29_011249 [Rhizopus arrhizus]KAG1005221.1 hypothetical protein G6F27_009418 [Rhizopus arrhizus]KAG1018109.1 hypothetical protein G6F26_011204 [Rhizopus arrhizus]
MSLSVHRVLKTRRQSRWACFNESIWDFCGSYRLGIDEQQKAGLFTERSMQTLLDSILRFKSCRSFKKEGTASFGYDGLLIKQPNSFSGKSLSRFLLQHELDVNQSMPNPIVTFSTQHPCL